MAAGDEYGLTEDLYRQLIGSYVVTIEVLSKRIFAKDQYIAQLEAQLAQNKPEEILYVEKGSDVPVIKKVNK